jgi:hypothetical protein
MLQGMAESLDGSERGPQIVRDRITERLQFLLHTFKVGRAFLQPERQIVRPGGWFGLAN